MSAFLLAIFLSSGVYASKISHSSKKSIVTAKKKKAPKRKNAQRGEVIKVLATAYYAPKKGQDDYATGSYRGDMKLNGGKKTFTGKVPKVGMVAVDPKLIPLGTQIYIPELDLKLVAEDTGGKIKGKRIDIFAGEGEWGLEKALAIGTRKVTVVIGRRVS
ncbi:MAG: 3D domain-containing protein [Candidatus Moraniibacteriota bacterium]